MAATFTKLYLTTKTAPYTPATLRGAWDDTGAAVTKALDANTDDGGAITSVARAETNASATYDVLLYRGVSGQLAAQTISGTIDVVLGVLESSASADMVFHLHVYVTQGDSDTPRGTLLTDYIDTSEWPTTAAGKALASAQTLSSLAISDNDRLVVEIGYQAQNSVTTSFTGTLRYGVTTSGVVAADLSASDTNVTTKAGYIVFSSAITQAAIEIRESQAWTEVAADTTTVEIRHSQSWTEIAYSLPPSGGGGVPDGTNPAVGNLPTTLPLKFVQLTIDGSTYYAAETTLNDASTWYGGQKIGRLVGISTVRRELSREGAFVTSRCTVTLADTDRVYRTLAASAPFRGAYVALYVVDDSVRRAEGEPFRYFAGEIVNHRAVAGFRYEIEIEDVMGRRLAEYNAQPQLPPDVFTSTIFPGLDPSAEGKAIPIVCGQVSDQDSITPAPQGVVPLTYVGQVNFQDLFGGADLDADAYIWSQGAFPTNGIWQVYYNDPATPDARALVPGAAWGTIAWTPGYAGWSDVGSSTDYLDYSGRRYMALFILRSDPIAEAVRSGKVFVAGNIYGVEDEGDGSGSVIDAPVYLWQFLLTNYVFTRYTDGAFAAIPDLNGYSLIDTDTVDAVATIHGTRITGGYIAGFLLGRDGQRQSVFQAIAELCAGTDFEWGVNRHGQLIASAEDLTATGVVTFTAQADIEDGAYETWIDSDRFFNRLEATYGYRYIPPVAPPATPAEGEAAPTKLPPYSEWRSGLLTYNDPTSQSDVGEIVTHTLNNYAVQDGETAIDVNTTLLARALGPNGDGPRMFRFTTGWQGFGTGSTIVDLGSVVTVTHPERIGASATGSDTCRVLAIEVDPLRDRVTLEGMVIG